MSRAQPDSAQPGAPTALLPAAGLLPLGTGAASGSALDAKAEIGGSPPVHGPSQPPAGSQGGKVSAKFRFPVRLQLINQARAPEVR